MVTKTCYYISFESLSTVFPTYSARVYSDSYFALLSFYLLNKFSVRTIDW
jgi:hypothetical protein